jgi:ABC-type anion transport system duplicated permease subunit
VVWKGPFNGKVGSQVIYDNCAAAHHFLLQLTVVVVVIAIALVAVVVVGVAVVVLVGSCGVSALLLRVLPGDPPGSGRRRD